MLAPLAALLGFGGVAVRTVMQVVVVLVIICIWLFVASAVLLPVLRVLVSALGRLATVCAGWLEALGTDVGVNRSMPLH